MMSARSSRKCIAAWEWFQYRGSASAVHLWHPCRQASLLCLGAYREALQQRTGCSPLRRLSAAACASLLPAPHHSRRTAHSDQWPQFRARLCCPGPAAAPLRKPGPGGQVCLLGPLGRLCRKPGSLAGAQPSPAHTAGTSRWPLLPASWHTATANLPWEGGSMQPDTTAAQHECACMLNLATTHLRGRRKKCCAEGDDHNDLHRSLLKLSPAEAGPHCHDMSHEYV